MISHKVGISIQSYKDCRALVGVLYLFNSYALQYQLAFRNLIDYLGIALHFCLGFPDFARFILGYGFPT